MEELVRDDVRGYKKKISILYSHDQDTLLIGQWASLLLGLNYYYYYLFIYLFIYLFFLPFNTSYFEFYFLSAKRATTTNKSDESNTVKTVAIIAGISVAPVAVIMVGIICFRRRQENKIRRHTINERYGGTVSYYLTYEAIYINTRQYLLRTLSIFVII